MNDERMNRKRKNRPRRLTSGMVKVILTCWIIPYLVLSAVLVRVSVDRSASQAENTLRSSMESAGRIVMGNLNNAIEDSRQASYDGIIKKSYETFLKDGDESAMHRTVTEYLNATYKFSKTISNTILLYGDNVQMEYYTYSNVAGATYASIEEFKRDTAEAVRLTARDLDTKTRLICLSGHMYVVRNIVLSNYEPFATFVMELNMDRLLESMNGIIWKEEGIALLDGSVIYEWRPQEQNRRSGDVQPEGEPDGDGKTQAGADELSRLQDFFVRTGETASAPADQAMVFSFSRKENAGYLDMKVNGQRYGFAIGLDRGAMLSDRLAFLPAYFLVFIMLIPLLIATFYFFYTNINRPIGTLVEGSERIRGGEYGYQVAPFEKNQEIGRLVDNFNHMSRSLQESFRRIYAEEIAGRDATLKALQSQINPHFLNNTLEIINWKARMSGNDDVSEMISALSVMMNAALNRNNEMFISLEEELSYVDAYLYIIKQRFGDRFSFTKEVDPALLDCSVPRLIIQPIMENAVEHGGDKAGNRKGSLCIFGDRRELHIVVENNGTLSEKDKDRIAALLSGADELPAGADPRETAAENGRMDSGSIGIRNVHRRLRMLYGKDSGLSIYDTGDGRTRSEMIICRQGPTGQDSLRFSSGNQEETDQDSRLPASADKHGQTGTRQDKTAGKY